MILWRNPDSDHLAGFFFNKLLFSIDLQIQEKL
jgi:hypothetical protein